MLEFAVVDGGLLLGLLAASAVSAAGSIYANRANLKQQKSVNEQAISLADNAHQREVADLVAAGLNPVLSATGNGASVPSLGVANQDNVLSSFGANARGIAESVSKQRSLSNEALENDNKITGIESDIAEKSKYDVLNANIQSARAQAANDEYETILAEDKLTALKDLKYKGYYPQRNESVKVLLDNPEYHEMLKKSLKTDLSDSSFQRGVNWSNQIRSWTNTGINAANAVIGWRRGAAAISQGNSEDIRRQERHDYFKRKWR